MSADILQGFSEAWRGTPARSGPAPARADRPPAGGRTPIDPADVVALTRAARLARERYPGAAGELLSSEIAAFLQVGRRFAAPSTIMRLVAELLDGA